MFVSDVGPMQGVGGSNLPRKGRGVRCVVVLLMGIMQGGINEDSSSKAL